MAINAITSTAPKAAPAITASAVAKAAQDTSQKLSFKTELKDPMGIVATVMTVYQRIKADAIPVFKEEGVIKGIGATLKAVAAGAANFLSDAGLSFVLRKLTCCLPHAGIAFFVGNTLIGGFANRLIDKIFPTKMYDNMNKTEQDSAQNVQDNSAQEQYYDTLELSNKTNKNSYDSAEYTPSSAAYTTKAKNTSNPYNSKVAYTTSDGVIIYEKPDISMHNYLKSGGKSARALNRYA